jgi:predicted nucleotidyltransferase
VHPQHLESIRQVVEHFQKEPEVQALSLGGSLAHGLAGPDSDVDVMILVSDGEYEKRLRAGQLTFFDRQLCTYEGGYVDGKYVGPGFLERVAASGSEPARFAFQDARVLFSRIDGLETRLQAITRYPSEGKRERMSRFYAQLEAWQWYAHEALKRNNHYLLGTSIARLTLVVGRLILAHNELLYPYHKWFLAVLERAEDKPETLMACIRRLHEAATPGSVTAFYETVTRFQDWPKPASGWSSQFMIDSELNWLDGRVSIDDS